ncbi:hypothetical protein Goshw_018759 [Gossypium schwendimanii]|uniref:Uncharacterized protein n=4 Tax=Gossypium TaxID=3633 RepID=A0A7J9M5E2_GOSSC|nr:hypothetical protein [Gossypium lobatum]MBA0720163.1 hypothetical protein [Gossypium laxum]MBA0807610.1 hypothetical protein [Gossypium harknessii]MBA0866200.1 hypothetical protein [Gossypium schwendimanii]
MTVTVIQLCSEFRQLNQNFFDEYELQLYLNKMAVKPTVALRAFLVGGVAVFAKVAGAMKAAGGAKLGAAAAAMTVAASAAMTGSKQEQKDGSKQPPK